MNNAQLINQTSLEVEYYTPPEIMNVVRAVLGEIDLDPASSVLANNRIGAKRFFSAPAERTVRMMDDGLPVIKFDGRGGLDKEWKCETLWMNHPFRAAENACTEPCGKKRCQDRGYHIANSLPGNAEWIEKIEREWALGSFCQGCCITYACTSENWFVPLLKQPQCFLVPRTNYLLPDGSIKKGVTKGSVVTYFGKDPERFAHEFKNLGVSKRLL